MSRLYSLRNHPTITLQVVDDGQGFDVNEARVKRSLGLLGMREHAEMIQGTLDILGEPGRGTTITIRVPLAGPNGAGA